MCFQIGTYAGGGGQATCPGGNGGNGGKPGDWALNKAPDCSDKSAAGGNAGSASIGGGGGTVLNLNCQSLNVN